MLYTKLKRSLKKSKHLEEFLQILFGLESIFLAMGLNDKHELLEGVFVLCTSPNVCRCHTENSLSAESLTG